MLENLLEIKGLTKSYDGHSILEDINISLKQGEVHAIIGENGAGKTALMKILAGVVRKDSGEILLNSQRVEINSPYDAHGLGIYMVFDEINLVPSLSVVENIYLRNWIYYPFGFFPIINWKKQKDEVKRVFELLKLDINPHEKVENLGMGQKKMVEIAKAILRKVKILILDETFSCLKDQDIESLFEIIKRSREMGVSIFFITQDMNDVIQFADTITILNKGRVVQTSKAREIDLKLALGKITGKAIVNRYPKIKVIPGEEMLKVNNLSDKLLLRELSFSLRKGEILGLTGLIGSGRTAVAKTLFGLNPITLGKIYIQNEEVNIRNPIDAIKYKIAFIPEDKKLGLVYTLNVSQNISLTNLNSVVSHNLIDLYSEKKLTKDYVNKLGIKAPHGIFHKVRYLSSGNQQKVMIAKWLLSHSKIYIFDEPTKGLDVTSKVEFYNLINELVLKQASILFISSDVPELIGMCDRVLVLHKGKINKELKGKDINENNIIYYASGGI